MSVEQERIPLADRPLVSVVMSVFNTGLYLREALESILRQTYTNFEFVIINDGSTDNTPQILEEYRQKDSRIRIITQENMGLIAALNHGCGVAQGVYIARMDADDIALPERLEKQLHHMEQYPGLALLGSAIALMSVEGVVFDTVRYPVENAELQRILYNDNNFAHSSIMMRKQAFDAVGGYRPTFVSAEDYDLWMRIAERYEIANLPDILVQYRVHSGGVSAKNITGQLTAAIAARAASVLRRSGRPDPTGKTKSLTPELLTELGLPDFVLSDRLADTLLDHAVFWMQRQRLEEAFRYLYTAIAYVMQPALHRRRVARAYRCIARYYQQKRSYGKSILAILCAWWVRLFDGRAGLDTLTTRYFFPVSGRE